MEPEQVKGSNEHVQKTLEVRHEEDETPFTVEKNREVSCHPRLEVHSDEKGPPHNSSIKPEFDGNSSPLPESITSPDVVSASPSAETGMMQKSSPEPSEMKSPPIQTMGHPPGYDPNRIPASIFSSRTGNPADWSGTSNESLFSIHMGNNSFSRDYAILFGKSGELPKFEDANSSQSNPFMVPGELPRLEEWNNPQSSHRHFSKAKSNEFGSLPPVMEAPLQEESSVVSCEFPRIDKKDDNISPKFASGQPTENHGKENLAANLPAATKPPLPEPNCSSMSNPLSFPSPSRFSDASGHSNSSFAFPVLASNSGKNDSLKVVAQKHEKADQQPEAPTQPQVPKESPTGVSATRWFSCFSCWPRFC